MSDVTFVQGDTAPSVFGALTNNDGTPFDLSDATTIRFQMRLEIDRRFSVNATATVVDATGGLVRYDWAEGDLSEAGEFVSRWRILFDDSSVEHTDPEDTITIASQ